MTRSRRDAPIDPRLILAVFAGGFVGAALRALVVEALPHHGPEWPWATFAVNVAGAFALGWLVARPPDRLTGGYGLPLLGTGVCGALTTFSTMQLELLRMLQGGEPVLAVLYAGGSVAAGAVAVLLGSRGSPGTRPAV